MNNGQYSASSEVNGWMMSGEWGVGSGKLRYAASSEVNGWMMSGKW